MLEAITAQNSKMFDRLVQEYEHEFAPITGKKPGDGGKYVLDSTWASPNEGYYYRHAGQVIGFCIIGQEGKVWDVREFYIAPDARLKGQGKAFAAAIFDLHQGLWQVRQIEGADKARSFWRAAIDAYTKGSYKEEQIDDPYWGRVTRQQFVV